MTLKDRMSELETAKDRHQAGDITAAAEIYRRILDNDPQNPDAWHLLGLTEFAEGRIDSAELCVRQALEVRPDEREFQSNLAAILVNLNRAEEAEALSREVLDADPGNTDALCHLGTALRQQNRLLESLDTFQSAMKDRRDVELLCNVGAILVDLGRTAEARELFAEASELAPNLPELHINLGAIDCDHGDFNGAREALARAEQLAPDSYDLFVGKGKMFLATGQILDAIEEFQKAIAVDSSAPSAVSGLGKALSRVGCWEESLEAHRLAAKLDPENQKYQSSYLYSVSMSPLLSPDAVRGRHESWGRNLEASVTPVAHDNNNRATDRKLRIGYVSPDFRRHATMRFFVPLLNGHNREAVELFLYSETATEDDVTRQMQSGCDSWCPTRGLSDEGLCRQISNDEIDILVDIAGHTDNSRLSVFARKPAPVQVSFLGYPNTTGLSRIDYFLTDSIREPGDFASQFTETPWCLTSSACCYATEQSPEVSPPPCLENGHITFGSTYRIEKISPQSIELWARVLKAVPDSQLLLFCDDLESQSVRESLKQQFTHQGISTHQLKLGWVLPAQHLDIYSGIDIMLDVFPWGGGTIAYDAMWMGVPIPTIAGDRDACRTTASLMHHCGFPQFIAKEPGDYVGMVTELAGSPEHLEKLRSDIRPAMQQAVCNRQQFAADVEEAYRQMWGRYAASQL